MGEYFEITFFEGNHDSISTTSEKIKNVLGIADGRNIMKLSKLPLLKNKNVYFQSIAYSEFSMHMLSIENFVLTRESFEAQLDLLMQTVSICFSSASDLAFATGIYELTDYYLGESENMQMVLKRAFRYCPILFFRESNRYSNCASAIIRYHIACIVQSGNRIQNIISDSLF